MAFMPFNFEKNLHLCLRPPLQTGQGSDGHIVYDRDGSFVADCRGTAGTAAAIVRCVNSHDELVAALEAAHDWYVAANDDGPAAQQIRAALAKAGAQ